MRSLVTISIILSGLRDGQFNKWAVTAKKNEKIPVWQNQWGGASEYESGNDAFGDTYDRHTTLTDDRSETKSDDDSNNEFLISIKTLKAT